jgi:hypothetical protein
MDEKNALSVAIDTISKFLDGQVSYDELRAVIASVPDDDELDEVMELIVHTPKRDGLFGVSAERYDVYQGQIREALSRLRKRCVLQDDLGR